MGGKVLEGRIYFRQWNRQGLTETPRDFNSLDELYALCLRADAPEIVDRIVIFGQDEQGHLRVLTFNFQSITVSPSARP